MVRKLEIFVITYNRAECLRHTLSDLSNSIASELNITVLDNCSTDNTIDVCLEFESKLKQLKIISHKVNIGAGANFLRAFELSESEYTWVLCDDDELNLLHMEDILRVINEGEIDLIHVGAHPENKWVFGGSYYQIKDLISRNYPYFKFSSFLPCNIFNTKVFNSRFLLKAYSNIQNGYPHMPYLFGLYQENARIYLSKDKLVSASMGGQSYNEEQFLVWWMKTCELLLDKGNVIKAFLDQWNYSDYAIDKKNVMNFIARIAYKSKNNYIIKFLNKYLSVNDRLYFWRAMLYQSRKAM